MQVLNVILGIWKILNHEHKSNCKKTINLLLEKAQGFLTLKKAVWLGKIHDLKCNSFNISFFKTSMAGFILQPKLGALFTPLWDYNKKRYDL